MGTASSIVNAFDLTLDKLTVDVVAEYISQLSPQPTYEQYRDVFINNNVDGKRLSELDDDHLNEYLDSIGVTDIVHQTIIGMEIKKLKSKIRPFNPVTDLTHDGVKLKVFIELIKRMGGRTAIATLTTDDVRKMVIDYTNHEEDNKISYCDHVKKVNPNDVGVATVYVCHAWNYLFVDVVDALRNHFHDNDDASSEDNVYIWFDLFCVNQHTTSVRTSAVDHTWWGCTLQPLIRSIGHIVMVLSSWSSTNLIPLKRTWCLYELYCTIDSSCRFEVAMSGSGLEELMKTIAVDAGNTYMIVALHRLIVSDKQILT